MNGTRNPGEDDATVDLSRFDNEFAEAPVEEKAESVPDGKYQANVDKVEITTAKITVNANSRRFRPTAR